MLSNEDSPALTKCSLLLPMPANTTHMALEVDKLCLLCDKIQITCKEGDQREFP